MTWAADYIGLPFVEGGRDRTGCDCLGLVNLVYTNVFGIELPSFGAYATRADMDEVSRLARGEGSPWAEVPLAEARVGDVLMLRVQGLPIHVGVVVEPPRFLHTMKGVNAVLDDWRRPTWNRRVLGVYRHEALVGVSA